MLFSRGQHTQSSSAGGIASSFDIQLFPKPAKILWLVVYNREHPAKEEQVARLHRFHIGAKRRRRGRKLNAKFLQPAIRTARLRTLTAHHRPACAPPSTCSTSPVT